MKKIMAFGLLGFGLVSTAFAASDLTIVNNTNNDSTSIINNGICSNTLSGGVTKAHSTNVVKKTVIGLACLGHASNCKADVYMTNNCSGNKVASVVFDTGSGIKSITMNSNNFHISGSGFRIQLDPR